MDMKNVPVNKIPPAARSHCHCKCRAHLNEKPPLTAIQQKHLGRIYPNGIWHIIALQYLFEDLDKKTPLIIGEVNQL